MKVCELYTLYSINSIGLKHRRLMANGTWNCLWPPLNKTNFVWYSEMIPYYIKLTSCSPSVPPLKQLHWLPVVYRIKFKLTTVAYHILSTTYLICYISPISLNDYTTLQIHWIMYETLLWIIIIYNVISLHPPVMQQTMFTVVPSSELITTQLSHQSLQKNNPYKTLPQRKHVSKWTVWFNLFLSTNLSMSRLNHTINHSWSHDIQYSINKLCFHTLPTDIWEAHGTRREANVNFAWEEMHLQFSELGVNI